MDALEELSQNMYGSSQGSGAFSRANNPAVARFGDNEGADVLRMYPGGDSAGFGSPSQPGRDSLGNFGQDNDPYFGIDRQKDNFQRANNFIDSYVPSRQPGRMDDDTASFDKYSGAGGHYNEPYEDILDSIKGDTYEKPEETGRFKGPSRVDDNYSRRGNDYSDNRSGRHISVEARSIPDFERSQASSRDEDLRSMQPQGFRFTGQSWNKAGPSDNHGSSSRPGRRQSVYRNDNSPSGVDVIESSASRRMRGSDSRPVKKNKDDVPIFLAKKTNPNERSKPPLHKHASYMEDDDKLSHVKDAGPRSGRFREDDASDATSRRKFGQDNSFKNDQSGVPALESSLSRRSGRRVAARNSNSKSKEKDQLTRNASHLDNKDKPFGNHLYKDSNSFGGTPQKANDWEQKNKKFGSISPVQSSNTDQIMKIREEIREEEQRRKELEQEYRAQIKSMKGKHSSDMDKMQPPKNTDSERKELLKSLTQKLDREIERIQKQHEATMELEDQQHRSNLEREKISADQNAALIKRQLEQQIQIAELVKNVQSSSTKLESIMKTNMDVSEDSLRDRQKKTLELEREVNEKLTALVIKQRTYNDLEKKLDGVMKDYETLRAEKLRLQERDTFQFSDQAERYKINENKLIQEVTLLKLKVENQKEKQARLEKLLQDEVLRKQQELEDEKERFEREKGDADEQQREYDKKIQLKYLEIDERKKTLNESETYLLKKIQTLDHKNEVVARETDALRYKMEQLDSERVKFGDKAYMAQQTSIKVFEESEYVAAHRKEYEEDRAELEKMRYELEAEKAHARAEHLKLEHKRTEISMRERMIDQLKLNKVQEDLDTHQRVHQSAKPYQSEINSAVNSGLDFYRKSNNVENLSFNRLRSPMTSQKQEDIDRSSANQTIEKRSRNLDDSKERKIEEMYAKVNKRMEDAKSNPRIEEDDEAYDFNDFDESEEDDQ